MGQFYQTRRQNKLNYSMLELYCYFESNFDEYLFLLDFYAIFSQ